MTFSGVRFFLVGFDSATESQYRADLVRRGGVDVGSLDPTCTHLVVFNIVYDDPVCVAARRNGTAVVTKLWVDDCVDFERLVNVDKILYRPVKDFSGIPGSGDLKICLTGYQRQERDDIMKMVRLMGAYFTKPLIAHQTTHLICYKFEGEKYDLAKRVNIKLVNHRWLEDCLSRWKILPPDDYTKSGWELEFLEVQAKDSEEETEEEISRPSKQNSIESVPSSPTDLCQFRCPEVPKQMGESSKACEDIEASKHSVDNDRLLSTPGNHCNPRNDMDISSENVKDTSMEDHQAGGSSHYIANDFPADPLNENFTRLSDSSVNLMKGVNKLSVDFRNTKSSGSPEEKSTTLSYSRKTSKKILPEGPPNFQQNFLKENLLGSNNSGAGTGVSPLATNQTSNHDSINSQTPSSSNVMERSPGNLLPQKRKVSISGSDCRTPGLVPNLKPVTLHDATSKSEELKDTFFDANVAVEDGFVANKATHVALMDHTLDQDGNPLKSKSLSYSSKNIKSRKSSAGNKSADIFLSPSPQLTKLSCEEEPKQAMDFAANFISPSFTMEHKISDNAVSPARLSKVSCNDVSPAEAVGGNHMNNTTKQLESLILNVGSTKKSSSISEECNEIFFAQKAENAFVSDSEKLTKDVSEALDGSAVKQQKLVKKVSTPDSLKSDVTKLANRTSPEVSNGSTAIPKSLPKKMFANRKKLCSRPRLNTNRGVASKPTTSFDEKETVNETSLPRSEKCNGNLTAGYEGNVVVGLVSKDTGVKNNSRVNAQSLKHYNGEKSRTYLMGLSDDSEKENQTHVISVVSGKLTNTCNHQSSESMVKNVEKSKLNGDNSAAIQEESMQRRKEPVWFILSGHRLQRKDFRLVIKQLRGRVCRDSHSWSYQATHFIVPEPVRRTEKFFAAAAAGRWILKTDYLSASKESGKLLEEGPFEWYRSGLTQDGTIDLEAPRKWRLLKERTGHGAFYGLRIIIYGECIAPSLDTLKRVVKAGDGTILATSPPYTRFLQSSVDYAIISPAMPRCDLWIQEFLRNEIPCVLADYLVDYVCKPGHPLDRHVLFNTQAWAEKSHENLISRSEEVVHDTLMHLEADGTDGNELSCAVCGSRDRGEVMLICGDEEGSTGCGVGTHIDCCDPPLPEVPSQDWFCRKCCEKRDKQSSTQHKSRGKSKGKTSTKRR